MQELLKQLKQADQRSKKEVFAGDLELQEFYKDEERFWQHNMEEKCNIVKRIAEVWATVMHRKVCNSVFFYYFYVLTPS